MSMHILAIHMGNTPYSANIGAKPPANTKPGSLYSLNMATCLSTSATFALSLEISKITPSKSYDTG